MSLARRSNHSGSGKAAGRYQLAAWDRRIQSLCPPGDWLYRSLPGPFGIPKLVCRSPEPLAQVQGLLLPCRANLLFPSPSPYLPLLPQAPDSIYSWMLAVTSPPSLSAACLSQWLILPRVPSGPTANPTPQVLHTLVELGSWKGPERIHPTPSFDR